MVNWQDPETRLYHHVAWLTRDQDGSYEFAYLPTASKLAGFRPFVGFLISVRPTGPPHLFHFPLNSFLLRGALIYQSCFPRLSLMNRNRWSSWLDPVAVGGPIRSNCSQNRARRSMAFRHAHFSCAASGTFRKLKRLSTRCGQDVLSIETDRDNPVNPRPC
jgi:hypothetical protein